MSHRAIDELVPDFASLSRELQFLVRYARFMDAAVRIPGTGVRFGADAVVGIIPVVGDILGAVMSLYVFVAAVKHGVRPGILFRMVLRTAIDLGLGSIPWIGDLFDLLYHDKLSNVRLLLEHRTR